MHKSIVITGGHAATSALSLILELKKRNPEYKLFFIGNKYALEGKKNLTLEAKIIPKQGVKFFHLTTGKLQKKITIWTAISLLRIPLDFIRAIPLLLKTHPDVIISFGGYVSVPIVILGKLFRTPILIHEQIPSGGNANRFLARFADKVAISFPSSASYFPKNKVILTGIPILPDILKVPPKIPTSTPTIFFTGGSRGSQRLNKVIDESLVDILKNFRLIHLTGEIDYQLFKSRKSRLPTNLSNNYTIYAYFDPTQIHKLYAKADIVISRGGAHTVTEIAATRRPSIIIPIPWSYMNEQTLNAKWLEDAGLATILQENDLSRENLILAIQNTLRNWKTMSKASPGLQLQGATRLADLIESYIQ